MTAWQHVALGLAGVVPVAVAIVHRVIVQKPTVEPIDSSPRATVDAPAPGSHCRSYETTIGISVPKLVLHGRTGAVPLRAGPSLGPRQALGA